MRLSIIVGVPQCLLIGTNASLVPKDGPVQCRGLPIEFEPKVRLVDEFVFSETTILQLR